ncbi:MAG: hypothetical protein KatS3mg129_1021 [Leptospiraceae bacterium]|nr:MAG: hypothetical protein KatS3mg129_1021 [Leptospiraceae bacterium]
MKKFIEIILFFLLCFSIHCNYYISTGCKNLICDKKKLKEKEKQQIEQFYLINLLIQLDIESKTLCKNLSIYQFEELSIGQNYSFSVANYRWYQTKNTISGKIKFQITVLDPDCKIRPYFEYLCYDTLLHSTVNADLLYGGFLPTENCNTSGCWAQQGQSSEIFIQENPVYYIYRFEGRDNSNNYKSCNFNVLISEW